MFVIELSFGAIARWKPKFRFVVFFGGCRYAASSECLVTLLSSNMSLSRVCRRAAPLFKSTHHLPLESRYFLFLNYGIRFGKFIFILAWSLNLCCWWLCIRCIPNYNLSRGSTTSSVYQRHFGHDSMWLPKLGSFNKCGQHQPFAAQSLLGIQRLYSSQASTQEKSRKTLLYLTGLVFAMVAASYAAVPLYRRFCQATGYGGTIQRREVWFFSVIWVWFLFILFSNLVNCNISLWILLL